MGQTLFQVLKLLLVILVATCVMSVAKVAAAPEVTEAIDACPRPRLCSIKGKWAGANGVQLSVEATARLHLDVTYKARGQVLKGKARAGLTPMLRMVQVSGSNGTETPRCLEMVLICLNDELWVTELPTSGSFPANSYKLQPYQPKPTAPPPRHDSGSSGNRTQV